MIFMYPFYIFFKKNIGNKKKITIRITKQHSFVTKESTIVFPPCLLIPVTVVLPLVVMD